jgi:hypothetical protein
MKYGLKALERLPRLMTEIHGVLLSKGRGSKKEPGEFRLAIGKPGCASS